MSMEAVNNTLESVKARSATAAELAQASAKLTSAFLGNIAAAIETLDSFSAALPSEETLDALVNGVTTAQDGTLDAYSILRQCGEQTTNAALTEAVNQAEYSLEDLGASHKPGWTAQSSALTSATQLQTGIQQVHTYIAELKALATETGHMYQVMGDSVLKAVTEGDGAVTEITAYQQKDLGA